MDNKKLKNAFVWATDSGRFSAGNLHLTITQRLFQKWPAELQQVDRVPRYIWQLRSKHISRLPADYNDFHNWKLGKGRALSVLGINWIVFPICLAHSSLVCRHLLPLKGMIFPDLAFNWCGVPSNNPVWVPEGEFALAWKKRESECTSWDPARVKVKLWLQIG